MNIRNTHQLATCTMYFTNFAVLFSESVADVMIHIYQADLLAVFRL